MRPIIKWPGGKSSEIPKLEPFLPKDPERYIEPFFGGGAVYFHLEPERAWINDTSQGLMTFYRMIGEDNALFRETMYAYGGLWDGLQARVGADTETFCVWYADYMAERLSGSAVRDRFAAYVQGLMADLRPLFGSLVPLDEGRLLREMAGAASDKLIRTAANEARQGFRLSREDLRDNLLTGFTGGLYLYLRALENDIALGRTRYLRRETETANFFFIREYCYGSMFRYNRQGEFNIPYGGLSYNKKSMLRKCDEIFSEKTRHLLRRAVICAEDFEAFWDRTNPRRGDFIFLDPPYDTTFNAYEGHAFDGSDQERLAARLLKTEADFLLVIKNTELIRSLYLDRGLTVCSFDNRYMYNVRSRNDRNTEHLLITNLPMPEGIKE